MKCLLAFAVAAVLAAQNPQFDVQSRLVIVPVAVTDPQGRSVDGLDLSDFVILDNGRPQKMSVDTIATGVAPIALVIAVQTSGISKPVLEKVQLIGGMIKPVVTGERGCAAVVTFSDVVAWAQECTGDENLLHLALQRLRMGPPKTAHMLDAASEAIEMLRRKPNARRVLLLISETRDRGSDSELQQVLLAAQASGVTVYGATYSAIKAAFTTKSSATAEPRVPKRPTIPREESGTNSGGPAHCGPYGCPDPYIPPKDQRVDVLGIFTELGRLGKTNTVESLTMGTGGAAFPFAKLKGLEEALEKLGQDLHTQYQLSFIPDDPSAGYHTLEVRVRASELHVRARPGYWSVGVVQK